MLEVRRRWFLCQLTCARQERDHIRNDGFSGLRMSPDESSADRPADRHHDVSREAQESYIKEQAHAGIVVVILTLVSIGSSVGKVGGLSCCKLSNCTPTQ